MPELRRFLPLVVLGAAAAGAAGACASGPAIHRLGDYSTLQPLFTTPPNEKDPTRITVNLTSPAYVAALFVVPGRGTAIVYPTDSATNNRVAAGQNSIPVRFSQRPFNRDSMLAAIRRQQQGGGRVTAADTSRDTVRFGVRDPSPAASPIGYLLLVASPEPLSYIMLRRRVEGVSIPIDDAEALSTVMKLVKATLPDGATLAGYAQELDRSG